MAKRKMIKNGRKFRPQIGRSPTNEELSDKIKKTKWGKSSLTEFLDKAHRNILITYLKQKGYFEMLENLTEVFGDVQKCVKYSDEQDIPLALLLTRAFGNFLAATRLACSGQLSETYCQIRACLESGLYAFHIYKEPSLAKVWFNRHKDEEQRKKCIKSFRPGDILNKLKSTKQSLGNQAEKIYQTCIDWGAHPNERSVLSNVDLNQNKSPKTIRLQLFNAGSGFFYPCLLYCIDVGICVIKIFDEIYSKEFKQVNVEIRLGNIKDMRRRIVPGAIYHIKNSE
jgi:hypothetical protein